MMKIMMGSVAKRSEHPQLWTDNVVLELFWLSTEQESNGDKRGGEEGEDGDGEPRGSGSSRDGEDGGHQVE